jgi:four helix bundle protein
MFIKISLCGKKAMVLVTDIYRATIDRAIIDRAMPEFPDSQRNGLTNPLRRAAVSPPARIAEGRGRGASKGRERFLRIANGSKQEVETQLLIAENLGLVDRRILPDLVTKITELGRSISDLCRAVACQS